MNQKSNKQLLRHANNELGTLVPQHFDQHFMARDINRISWNKKINPHLTGSTGINRGEKRGEKNGPRILLAHLPWEWARVERKEAQTPRLSIHTNS
jgi:predicted MPP superfamily phosphohydrolase